MQKTKNRKTHSLSILALAKLEPYQPNINEKYMNKNQLLHFKRILETWRDQLNNEIERSLLSIQNKAINFPDLIDRATQEEEFNLELRNRERERQLSKKIEKTLERVQNNNFGFCETCEIEIGIRRLEARPTATLCIDCQTLAEIREKQING